MLAAKYSDVTKRQCGLKTAQSIGEARLAIANTRQFLVESSGSQQGSQDYLQRVLRDLEVKLDILLKKARELTN